MTEETQSNQAQSQQKKSQATGKASRSNRTQRVPVSGNRELLTVIGKDPYFHYRWVLDVDDAGERIQRFKMAGYEFVNTHEIEGHGTRQVDRPNEEGSIVKKPTGTTPHGVPQYLYLMKIPYDLFEEDQQAKMQEIEERERDMMRAMDPNFDDGRYGGVSISKGS